jgi:hypothetical protein
VSGGAAQPLVTSVALAADGTTGIAGTISAPRGRRVVAGVGAVAASPRGVTGDILSQPQVAVADGGRGAVVWSVGRRVVLSLCSAGRCARAVTVGRSQRNPAAQVAIDPASGRVLVLWRGSASGRNRLQWRITTNGRLGRVHTLGEFGDGPRIGTDASGRTVAVWLGADGVRTAARRRGEFTRPATVTDAPAQDLRLAVAADGEAMAAWRVPAPGGADVQSPRGTPVVATRTRATGFGPAQPLPGVVDAGTLSVALAGDGRAVLAFDRQADDVTATVSAAYRTGRDRPFGPAVALAPPQFVSTAFGAAAAIGGDGAATVAWAGAGAVSAARSDGAGAFGAPDALAPIPSGQSIPVLAAAAGSRAIVVWVDGAGGHAASAG